MQSQYRLELNNISKSFNDVFAVENVSLNVKKGEIHALLGENGAGKSTLVNILYGLLAPDSGSVFVNGQEVEINSPPDAIRLGIGMVHQHFMLVPTLTVLENVLLMLCTEHNGFLPKTKQVRNRIIELSQIHGLEVDPDAIVRNLTVGQQQRVEIVKALYNETDLLILDEPTAVLTPLETSELFRIIKRFAKNGTSVIFISHKLHELMDLCHRVTVLRGGKVVGAADTADISPQELSYLMIGKTLDLQLNRETLPKGDIVLRIEDFVVKSLSGAQAVDHLDLEISAGEVYGIAGVDGNGQSELIKAISALIGRTQGDMSILHKKIAMKCHPSTVLNCNVAHIPEDRQKIGTMMQMSVADNLIIHNVTDPMFRSKKLLSRRKIRAYANDIVSQYDIRVPSVNSPFYSLSGGNQQKVVVARELEKHPRLLLAMHPTRGVDIGALDFIHKQIIRARNQGCAVLLISTELEEILTLSDRIGVIYKGKIIGEMNKENICVKTISQWMMGI